MFEFLEKFGVYSDGIEGMLDAIRDILQPHFNSKQKLWMWTSDRGEADSVWYVNFN